MRLTEFWARMNEHFGPAYAESFAQDHVIGALGGRTVQESLAAGLDAKEIWRAVCVDQEVPQTLR